MGVPEPLVVALGERRYRVERPWGELPSGLAFDFITQLAIDSEGRVYVFRRGDPPVIVFEPSGAFRVAWGEGRIADAQRLSMMSPDGALAGRCRPVLNLPHGVWGNADGDIFLAEINPTRVTKLALMR